MKPTDHEISLRRPTVIIVGLLTLAGLFVRIWGLWNYYPTPDEALVLGLSSQPTLPRLLAESFHHPHPPLRYIVLHYLLYFSDNLFFLRSIAIIPGVAMIPIFFILGRRTAGTASGIAMAAIAAFGHAGMMLSEVLRAYVMGALFVSVGLTSFFAYAQDQRSKHLVFYSAAMALGLLSHFSTMLPLTAICVVWAALVVRSNQKLKMGLTALAANLPVGAIALTTYWFHLSSRNPGRWWLTLHEGRMGSEYPASLAGFIVNTLRLFHYLFLPQQAWGLLLLFGGGLGVLWVTRRRVIEWVILLTICLNVVLTIELKYPFGGVRQSFFLLPLISISIGAAVQYGWDLARSLLVGVKVPDVHRWATAHQRALGLVMVALFSLGVATASFEIAHSDFLRHRFGRGKGELPVMQEDVNQALSFLKGHMKTGDVILAERQVMLYAELAGGRAPVFEADGISKIRFEGLYLYRYDLDYGFFLDSRERIYTSIERLIHHVNARGESKIWVVSIGWQHMREIMGSEICGPPMTDAWSHGGASVYGFRVSAVAKEIARNSSAPSQAAAADTGTPY